MYQKRIGLIFRASDASEFGKRVVDRSPARLQCFGRRTRHVFVYGHRRLRRLVKDHFGSSRKSDKSKRERSRMKK